MSLEFLWKPSLFVLLDDVVKAVKSPKKDNTKDPDNVDDPLDYLNYHNTYEEDFSKLND